MKHVTMYGAIAACLVILIGWLAVGTASGGVSAQNNATPTPDLDDILEAAQIFSGGNADWTPVIEEIDGVEMVLVPAGCFQMGSNDGDSDEQPVHEVCFSASFWLDRYEVSQGQFAEMWGQAAEDSYFTGEDRPREQITWFEARDYCEQRGARLPSEAEWEYAARGPDGLEYPWGDTFDWGKVVGHRTERGGTAPVGSIEAEAGVSWVGALDMSGNVWEWVNSLYQPYPYSETDGRESNSDTSNSRVLRGGSWYDDDTVRFRAAYRYYWSPHYRYNDAGFRCARSG